MLLPDETLVVRRQHGVELGGLCTLDQRAIKLMEHSERYIISSFLCI